jgi:hypothetical protein
MLTEHGCALPISQGVVKTYMLPGGICASFSNSPELAIRDFMAFAKKYPEGTGFSDAISFFESASSNSGNDYLVAFARHSKLIKIADGKRERSDQKTLWIGDEAAYQRFREYEVRARRPMEAGRATNAVMFVDEIEKSPASDLYSAMRRVLSDRQLLTVGGFAYVVSDRVEGFRQSAYCDMLFDWPAGAAEDFSLDLNDKIDFGASGENRQFAIAQATPNYLNLNAVAFYLLAGRKLFVFAGTQDNPLMRCIVLDGVEPVEVAPRLNHHFGEDLAWRIQVLSAAPAPASTQFRGPLIATSPNGVSFQIQCHVNTFRSTAAG